MISLEGDVTVELKLESHVSCLSGLVTMSAATTTTNQKETGGGGAGSVFIIQFNCFSLLPLSTHTQCA